MKTTCSVAIATLLSSSLALANPTTISKRSITPVEVKGNAFFAGDTRFYIRGLDYQPGGAAGADTKSGVADPIADVAGCKRDIEYFKDLGINTIRVYSVDNSLNHDECMNMLADAGIYLALDVNNPRYALNRDDPQPSYNDVYLQSVFATIDAFQGYDNTLLFFSGNEVINTPANSNCAPYIKAVTRDMKQYIRSRGYRQIPVGYSAADVEENRYQTALYMNCGTPDSRSDFFAFNDYSWCDPSSIQTSGWADKVKQYGDYSIPLFLSEYGCIKGERKFEEVGSLYSPQMTPVYSGGLVYEYSEEGTDYGIVVISGNNIKTEGDYTDLKNALEQTPAPSDDGGYKADGTPSKCPPKSANWEVGTDLLPAIPEPALKYMTDGAGKGPGLNGPGSMEAGTGTTSSGNAEPGSGTVGASESSSGAAVSSVQIPQFSMAPLVCGLVVLMSSVFGATLL
jgi:hypothetical protein